MDQPPPSAAEPSRNHDRLNGWKEIASHFGKSVRTVQRWEKELRLPVHRIHTPNGEIVFALLSELREWEQAQASPPPADPMETPEQSNPASGPVVAAGAARRMWKLVSVVAATAVLAIAAWELLKSVGWNQVIALEHSQPARWRVEGNKLRVWDPTGLYLWERELETFSAPQSYNELGRGRSAGQLNRVEIVDLDGDGRNEVLVAVYADDRTKERLICYEHNGRKRFEYSPPKPAEYGGAEAHPPPMVSPSFLVTEDSDRMKHIWVTFVHNLNFPAVLVKLSRHGRELQRYWSNGHINVLAVSTYQGKRVMLAGAMHNESRGASLAALDYENPGGSAPAAKAEYRCVNCPPGSPLKFLVFPQNELGKLNDERASASELRVAPDGRAILNVRLFIDQLPGNPDLQAGAAIYTLAPDLTVIRAEHEDSYRKFHAHYWKLGKVKHQYAERDRAELGQVRLWEDGRFIPLALSGKSSAPPGAPTATQ